MNYWTGKSHSLERDSKQSNYSIHINIFILINIQKLPVTESFFFPLHTCKSTCNQLLLPRGLKQLWDRTIISRASLQSPLIQLQSVPSTLFVPPEGWDKTILLVLPMTSDGLHLKNCYNKKLQEIYFFFFLAFSSFFLVFLFYSWTLQFNF